MPSAAAPTTPIGVLAECDEATKAFLEYLDDQQTEGRKFLHRYAGEGLSRAEARRGELRAWSGTRFMAPKRCTLSRLRKLGELDWGEDDKVRVLIEEAYYDFAKKHLRDFFRRNIYENPMRE